MPSRWRRRTDLTVSQTYESLTRRARSFHAKKRLGQNFLVDPAVLERIVDSLDPEKSDTVLEIGPGLGFMTAILAERAGSVFAVELDSDAVAELEKQNLKNVVIEHGDFLQFDLNKIGVPVFKVAGNVPYQITTPIVARLFGEIGAPSAWLKSIKTVVLTVQKEVAERFVGRPGSKSYSQITLLIDYFARAEIVEIIPPDAFWPRPEVTSAVVRMTPHAEPSIQCKDHILLRQIIQAGFRQRRKMLKNNLTFTKRTQDEIARTMAALKLDPMARAERLSLAQFARLADALSTR